MATEFKPCAVEECNGNAHPKARGGKGWCRSHHWRWKKYGDPLGGRPSPGIPLKWLNDVALTHRGDGCLIWPFGHNGSGYGKFAGDSGEVYAHRWVCKKVHGDPPTTTHQSAHSCGKGRDGCVSPNHLRWATVAENHADKIIHDTHNRGARHGQSKLTLDDVVEIQRRIKNGEMQKDVAEDYGVVFQTVSKIARGERWSWTPNAPTHPLDKRCKKARGPVSI